LFDFSKDASPITKSSVVEFTLITLRMENEKVLFLREESLINVDAHPERNRRDAVSVISSVFFIN